MSIDLSFIRHERERTFARTFFDHSNWTYQPGPFYLDIDGEQKRFTPDFWDGERDVYIEVVGSRQAYHNNKIKYQIFAKKYHNFEVRNYKSHEIIDFRKSRISFSDSFVAPNRRIFYDCCLRKNYDLSIYRDDLIQVIVKSDCTIKDLANSIGIAPDLLGRVINNMNCLTPYLNFILVENYVRLWSKYPNFFNLKSNPNSKNTKTIIQNPFFNNSWINREVFSKSPAP